MERNNTSGAQDPATQTNLNERATNSGIENEFYEASKKWRKQLNHLQSEIVSQRNLSELERESRALEECMLELTAAQEALENVQSSTVEKLTLYGKFEDMSRETNQILRQVGETIRDLRLREDDDNRSVVSRRTHLSVSSSKSKRSKSSRSSAASTSSSARLRRLDLEEEIATIRVKMSLAKEKEQLEKTNRSALVEIEKRKLEIEKEEQRLMKEIENSKERFKLKEELAEKEARVEACARFEYNEMPVMLDEGDQENATVEQIENFLRSQAEHLAPPTEETNEPIAHDDSNPPQANKLQTNREDEFQTTPMFHPNPSAPSFVPTSATPFTIPPSQPFNTAPLTSNPMNLPPSPPGATNPDLVQVQLYTITKLLEAQNQNRLPLPEPGIFSGNPLQYPTWVKAFETLIEGKALNPTERLHFLGKYVSGEAKEVVNGFMLLDGDDAYLKAKEMLAKRFGDPFVVATSFRKRLDDWKPIAFNDAIGLRKYADFLVQCEAAMKKISGLNVLNDVQENHKMISKLPKWLSTRWARVVYKSREEEKKFPTFSKFVKFLVTESNIACDPVNIKVGRNNEETKKPFLPRQRAEIGTGRRNFATNSEEGNSNNGSPPKNEITASNSCQLCKGTHDLNSCKQFHEMDIQKRKKFAKDKGLCFSCLGQGHLSKQCKQRKKCETCGKLHPTSLHGDFKENKIDTKEGAHSRGDSANSGTVNCTKACFMNDGSHVRISSMIIPVWIHHSDNSETERLVYALLDDQSDTTFVTHETLDSLSVSGPETQLRLSTMHAENEVIPSNKVKGLVVRDYKHSVSISLPTTFSCTSIPARRTQIPCPEMVNQWPHLAPIAELLMPYQHDVQVGLLIGSNCSRAIMPREIIPGHANEPYAQKTELGWGVIGNVTKSKRSSDNDCEDTVHVTHRIISRVSDNTSPLNAKICHFSIKTTTKEIINPTQVREMMESDFSERRTGEQPMSQEDRKFIQKMEQGIHQRSDGHYEMPLPFREEEPKLPNNKSQALHRLNKLKTRMENDEQYCKDYVAFMKDLVERGYAVRVPEQELSNHDDHTWYIPHHGVYHPKKPTKIRVVFDCSAKYKGESLNNHLLQGPDLTNQLLGVLCRFRQSPIAFMCDVESMFHQFKVIEAHQNFLRFLWWENGDTTKPPVEFRMTVHLFGAGSSPGCANYGLKQIANDYEKEFGKEAANFVKDDFYVDDGLKSVPTVSDAISLIKETKNLCAQGGLRLHKFVSNSRDVIERIPPNDRASGIKNIDLHKDDLPVERALGVEWCIESDSFQLRVSLQNKPPTRRGILSTISSIYDPIGFVAPLLLQGKQMLQELCREGIEWDDPVPEEIRAKWEKWRSDLFLLNDFGVRRCFQPENFGELKSVELHHFSDASTSGYGQCSYLRLVDEEDNVHCSFVMGKARVSPLKTVTIPRLELTAALVSVKVSNMLHKELNYKEIVDVFWTDSKVVLAYISNDARRFHVFVANRIQQIRESTSPDQWRYVESKENPADDASRGLRAQELLSCPRWLSGPEFLWKQEIITTPVENPLISDDDPEVKKVKSLVTQRIDAESPTILQRLEYFSDWHRAKRAIAVCLRLRKRLNRKRTDNDQNQAGVRPQPYRPSSVEELRKAEVEIVKAAQHQAFPNEIQLLRRLKVDSSSRKDVKDHKANLKKNSALYRLDPFMDSEGLLRVGGRINRADVPFHIKHPVVIPRKGHITSLIIRYYHYRVNHQGRGITHNEIRENGFWIVGGSSAVSSLITECVTCRRLRGTVGEQKMAELPSDRLQPAPPFTFCAVDYFGPWHIKEGRKELKRYGVLFTCLTSRAIHLEAARSLETDTFINVLRRFLARRGPVRQLRSDQGTNLSGARRELKEALAEMNKDKVRSFLVERECDWFDFVMNVPSSSHMGGVWERQIRTARNVINALLLQAGTQLDEESLQTFLCETEAIVNSRPLTISNLSTPTEAEPLTPNHLLTMKSRVLLPPPGEFQQADLYLVKRWRRVQYLVNQFWSRWRKEFLSTLQERKLWNNVRRNMQVGDIVLIKEDNIPRNLWRMACVNETYVDDDGLVRKVKLTVADPSLNQRGERVRVTSILERPIQKLVLLQKATTTESEA